MRLLRHLRNDETLLVTAYQSLAVLGIDLFQKKKVFTDLSSKYETCFVIDHQLLHSKKVPTDIALAEKSSVST